MIYRPNSASNGGAEALLWPGKSIPLSPDKALLIAQKWCLLHGFADPDLVFMDIDPSGGLRCSMTDADGRIVSTEGSGSGGGAGATWITLPYDSIIQLRANMYGYGNKRGEGLNLILYPPQAWQLRADDTNTYYLSGTFTVTTPTNFIPKDFEASRAVWSGTLDLPKMKITVPKP